MTDTLSILLGAALCLISTLIWLKMRDKDIALTMRVAVMLIILLSSFGFLFSINEGSLSGITLLGFTVFSGLCYTFLIDSKDLPQLKSRSMFIQSYKVTEFAFFSYCYFAFPVFVTPLIHHPLARTAFTLIFIWQLAGIILYTKPFEIKNRIARGALSVFFVMIFGIPVYLAPILTPVLVTLIH